MSFFVSSFISSIFSLLRYVNITAWDERDLKMAEDLIKAITDPPTTIVMCDPKRVRDVIGPRGATVKELQVRKLTI